MGDNEDNEPPLPKRVKRRKNVGRELIELHPSEVLHNYGRAPLIRDFLTDSPRSLSSANVNDAFGGGMSASNSQPLSLSPIRENTSFSFLQLNSTSMEDAASESNSFLKEFYSSSMEDAASESNSFLKEFYIPDYILLLDAEHETLPKLPLPECPVIVFINSKLCGNMLPTYRSLLNEKQVIDLLEEAPDKFLSKLYLNLEKLKHRDDELALRIHEKLRIIVAGGDGTAVWILRVLCDLNLSHPPPIATVPLGTGNNLPFAFGWEKNPGTDRQSAKSFLHQVMKAKEMKIDNWHLLMRMTTPKEANCNPIAPLELPHSFHSFERVSASDSSNIEGYLTFRGGFWNYFSMGMDAQVSYAFHSEKNLHPDKFKNQLVNQGTYARLGCTKGWFLDSLLHPADKNIQQLASVKVMKKQATEWEELHIPHSIRSIVCLNLPSFSGGLNPWGTPNENETRNSGFTPPCVDDGLIEVVGFTDVWHGLVLLAPNGHGTRLAQANRVRFEFRKGATDHTFMRIDGEPWKQPLPVDDDTVVVEISHHGQVHMLATDGCRSRSIQDPTSLDYSGSLEDDKEDESVAEGEKWRIPDEVDISRLS